MAIAIVAGILAGAVGLSLLYAGIRFTKRMEAQSSAAGYLTPVLLAVGGSFIVLALATVACVVVARDLIVPFVLAEAGTLIVVALGYGIAKAIRK